MIEKQKLNTEEAAEVLGVKPNTLEIWRCKHKGPRYAKIGTRVIYDKADLDEYFEAHRIETLETSKNYRRNKSQR